jgi:hypothetical protein
MKLKVAYKAPLLLLTFFIFAWLLFWKLDERPENNIEELTKSCTHVFHVHRQRKCYRRNYKLCTKEVGVYILLSAATIDRYRNGPFKYWSQMRHDLNINLYIAQSHALAKEAISLNIKERADNLVADLSFSSLVHFYKANPNLKWYLKLDDDAYLFVSNFLDVLSSLNPNDDIVGGKLLISNSLSGGAGYFMSNSVMKSIADNYPKCWNVKSGKGGTEDDLFICIP